MQSPSSDSIPDHLIEQILLNLPAKSLVRFQCLSKTWRDEISDPYFARTHLQRNRTNSIVVATKRSWQGPERNACTYNIGIFQHVATNYGHSQTVILDWNPHHSEIFMERNGFTYNNGYFHVVAIADGVLCVAACQDSRTTREETELVFWNPTTRKQKTLTVPTSKNTTYAFGFGYDSSIDDYKVVKLTIKEPGLSIVRIFEVLEMKSGEWRRIYSLPSSWISLESLAVSLDGSLYWQTGGRNNDIIIPFDLGTETFGEVSVPDGIKKMELLSELQGKLCCVARFSSDTFSPRDILALKDGIWVKLFKVLNFDHHGACFIGDRAIVIANSCNTFYIDDMKSSEKSLSILIDHWWSEVACPQSLVSI